MNDFIKNHIVEPCDSKKHYIGIYNMNIYTGPVKYSIISRTCSISTQFLVLVSEYVQFYATIFATIFVKAWPNAHKISAPHPATLLGIIYACCIRLATLLRYVAMCCNMLDDVSQIFRVRFWMLYSFGHAHTTLLD